METKINISKTVSNKVKHLRKDKLYNYTMFNDISDDNREAFRKAMSRLADNGVIVKVGSKKFYKRGERDSSIKSNNTKIKADPYDKKLVRSKVISAKYLKSKLHRNLFWSNSNGMISVENVICKIISDGSLSDLDFARFNFGDDKVIEVFMKKFNINENSMVRNLLNV